MTGDVAVLDAVVFSGRRYGEALLVEQGRVVVVGSRSEVLRAAPTGAERLRVGGRLVIPGLVDPHLHLSAIIQGRSAVDLTGARNVVEIAERASVWASTHPRGPVVGQGWDDAAFDPPELPTREALDRSVTDRPMILFRVCGHAAAVNSATLERLGMSDRPPYLAGGRVGVDAAGRPNGLLYERAVDLLRPILAERPVVRPEEVARLACELAAMGITRAASLSASMEEAAAIDRAAESGPLACGFQVYLRADEWHGNGGALARRGAEGERPLVAGVKAFADGSFGARTAWLEEPYADVPEDRGMSIGTEAELTELVRSTSQQRTPVAIHAIGDRALRAALGAFAEVPDAPTPRIEHASLASPSLWRSMQAFPGTYVVQPTFAWTDGWIPERLGRSRSRWAYAWRTMRALGLRLAGSSDAPFDDPDPWRGMAAAVRGPPWRLGDPEPCSERSTEEEALRLYTEGGHTAMGVDGGEPWPGADDGSFVVLDAPDLALAVRAGRGSVAAAWRKGRPAWSRDGRSPSPTARG
ncbi:MAG TPA: amidohydrolase [Thermoplasmata archaeon]|nr:amidohydrolase [Thermoplasmata archaeon]